MAETTNNQAEKTAFVKKIKKDTGEVLLVACPKDFQVGVKSISTGGNFTVLGSSIFKGPVSFVSGAIKFQDGLSGSLTQLRSGKSFIEAGSNITITSASNGAITIAASGGEITVTEADGSPSVTGVTTLKFSNGTVTDNGDNSVTVTTTTTAVAADDITAGDAAVSISTTSGNVTVDSNAGSTTVDGHAGVIIQSSNSGHIDLLSAGDFNFDATGNDFHFTGSNDQAFFKVSSSGSAAVLQTVQSGEILKLSAGGNLQLVAGADMQIDLGGNDLYFTGSNDQAFFKVSSSGSAAVLQTVQSGEILKLSAGGNLQLTTAADMQIDLGGNDLYFTGSNDQAFFKISSSGSRPVLAAAQSGESIKIDSPIHIDANVSGDYVATIDNDQSTAGHVLKLITDGNGSGTRVLEMEDGDGDTIFRARADGRFGFGPDGVDSMGAGTFVVGIDNSSHTSDIAISKRLQHLGDSNTYMDFTAADQIEFVAGGVDMIHMTEDDSQDMIVFNEGGVDVDFRVESNNNTHAIFVDAANDKVGIGTSSPDGILHLDAGTSNTLLVIEKDAGTSGSLIFHNAGTPVAGIDYSTNEDIEIRNDTSNKDIIFNVNDGGVKTELMRLNGSISRVSVTGTLAATSGVSGSLTRLTDGKSFIEAGANITVTSASNGAITIAGQQGDITGVTAGAGLQGGGTIGSVTLTIRDNIVANLTGTNTFSGNNTFSAPVVHTGRLYLSGVLSDFRMSGSIKGVGVAGIGMPSGLSGSLTRLSDGKSFIEAGAHITIASASNGAITITGTAAGEASSLAADNITVGDDVVSLATSAGNITVDSQAGSTIIDGHKGVILKSTNSGHIDLLSAGDFNFDATGNDFHFTGSNNQTFFKLTASGSAAVLQTTQAGEILKLSAGGNLQLVAGADMQIDLGGNDLYFTGSNNQAFFKISSSGSRPVLAAAQSGDSIKIDSSVHIDNGTSNTQLVIEKDAGTSGSIIFNTAGTPNAGIDYSTNEDLEIRNDVSNKDIIFNINDGGIKTELMRLDGSVSRVGIGTTTPEHTLSVTGTLAASTGISGSLTRLTNGKSFIEAGANITITSASNGAVTITASDAAASLNELSDVTYSSGDLTISSLDKIITAGGLTLDAGGDIYLDAAGADILFVQNETVFASFTKDSNDLYLNFGAGSTGQSGYGFRSNGGTLQKKHSTDGSWTDIVSSLNDLSDVTYTNGNLVISSLDAIVASGDLSFDAGGNDFHFTGSNDQVFFKLTASGSAAVLQTAQAGEILKLSADGTLKLSAGADMELDAAGNDFVFVGSNNQTFFKLTASGSRPVLSAAQSGESIKIDSSVHIDNGTSNTLLVIEKDAGTSGSITFHTAGVPNAGIDYSSNEDLEIRNDVSNKDIIFNINDNGIKTELMRLDGSTSMVGIGATSPEAYLDIKNVVDDGTTNRTMLRLHNYRSDDADVNDFGPISIDFDIENLGGGTKTGTARIAAVQCPVGTDHTSVLGEKTSGLIFSTMNDDTLSEAMRINAVGSIGIGTTDPKLAFDVHYTGSTDPTGLSNDTGGGDVVYFGTNATVTAGKLYYLNTAGAWDETSAASGSFPQNSLSGSSQLLAISLGTNPNEDGMLIRGFFDAHSHLNNFSKGKSITIHTASGKLDTTYPSGSGDFIRIIGYCTDTTNVIYFNPAGSWVEIA